MEAVKVKCTKKHYIFHCLINLSEIISLSSAIIFHFQHVSHLMPSIKLSSKKPDDKEILYAFFIEIRENVPSPKENVTNYTVEDCYPCGTCSRWYLNTKKPILIVQDSSQGNKELWKCNIMQYGEVNKPICQSLCIFLHWSI